MENKILHALENLNGRFDNLENRFDNLENRFDNLENRLNSFETETNKRFNAIDNNFDFIDKRFNSMDKRFDLQESQLKENTKILQALMHSAEVNKAEHDKMMVGIARIEGDVSGIKKDLSTMEVVTANNYADIARLKAVK